MAGDDRSRSQCPGCRRDLPPGATECPNCKVDLTLRQDEVVRTEDPFVKQALENYHPPKIPIKHHPGEVESLAYHDYDTHKDTKPFTSVAANTTHQHVL